MREATGLPQTEEETEVQIGQGVLAIHSGSKGSKMRIVGSLVTWWWMRVWALKSALLEEQCSMVVRAMELD